MFSACLAQYTYRCALCFALLPGREIQFLTSHATTRRNEARPGRRQQLQLSSNVVTRIVQPNLLINVIAMTTKIQCAAQQQQQQLRVEQQGAAAATATAAATCDDNRPKWSRCWLKVVSLLPMVSKLAKLEQKGSSSKRKRNSNNNNHSSATKPSWHNYRTVSIKPAATAAAARPTTATTITRAKATNETATETETNNRIFHIKRRDQQCTVVQEPKKLPARQHNKAHESILYVCVYLHIYMLYMEMYINCINKADFNCSQWQNPRRWSLLE